MLRILIIGAGGFLGANLRYLVQGWAAQRWGGDFPYGTLIANVTGSFVLALFLTLATQRFVVSPEVRLFFAIGVLGGYTTFSSFTFETLSLVDTRTWLWASLNFAGNILLGFAGAYLGVVVARLL